MNNQHFQFNIGEQVQASTSKTGIYKIPTKYLQFVSVYIQHIYTYPQIIYNFDTHMLQLSSHHYPVLFTIFNYKTEHVEGAVGQENLPAHGDLYTHFQVAADEDKAGIILSLRDIFLLFINFNILVK